MSQSVKQRQGGLLIATMEARERANTVVAAVTDFANYQSAEIFAAARQAGTPAQQAALAAAQGGL